MLKEKKLNILQFQLQLIKKNLSSDEFDFILESKGQIDEKRILDVTINNINKMLQNFMKLVPDNKGMEGKMVIPNGDHTLEIY